MGDIKCWLGRGLRSGYAHAVSRFFNTAGPCVAGKHYLIASAKRLHEVSNLISREQYFMIHAARQSGKTTLLLDQRHYRVTDKKIVTVTDRRKACRIHACSCLGSWVSLP